ncbi:hypothetical protein YC2023_070470 [Brassica napus]
MWGGTSSIGSCEAELRYISGWLSPNPLDISSVLHQGRRLRGVLVEFQVEISMWRQLERV